MDDKTQPYFQTRSESVTDLMAALARARILFTPVLKDKAAGGGAKKYKYAPLDKVIDATFPALLANGLVLSDDLVDGAIVVTLDHAPSGQWKRSRLPIPDPLVSGWQNFGSAVTYARRYMYSPMVGLASEDDDDAAGADAHRNHGEQPDPFAPLWSALESLGIIEPAAAKAWCEAMLGRALPKQDSLTLADLPQLMAAATAKPEPPTRHKASKEEALRLMAELGRMGVVKDDPARTKKENQDAAKAAALAWVNGMRPGLPMVGGALELYADEIIPLISLAREGRTPQAEPLPAFMGGEEMG